MAPTPPLDHRPIVISGPSGSLTTRKPRTGEVDGVNYFFTPASTFSNLISENAFIEHAFFSGNYYGTSKQTVTEQTVEGLIAVLDIDMQGVKQMKADPSIDASYVFIKPPNPETLEACLRSRGTENSQDVQKRLAQAELELEYS